MSEPRNRPGEATAGDSGDAEEPRQPARLSDEEVREIEELEELEAFMKEPTGGSLSIISDEDIPGAPG